jgi:purine nucleoside permease
VLILRGASDYTVGPPGLSAADFLAKEDAEGFPATPEALSNLYAVAAPVARALTDDWTHTRDTTPGAAP